MNKFSSGEKRILNTLYVANKPLTTKKLAEKTDISWQTAKKYLESLYKKDAVDCGQYGKSVYWWLKA